MGELPRPALQLVEPLRADRKAPNPCPPDAVKPPAPPAPPAKKILDPIARAISEQFPNLGEVIAGRGPHG